MTRLSDKCGYLQISRDWNLPYRVPLLLADRLDALHGARPTNPTHHDAWREANRLISDRKSFDRFLQAIHYLRERFEQIKRGEIDDPFAETYYPFRP